MDGDTASLVYAEWGAVRARDADWSVSGVLPLAATGDLTGDGYDDLVLATSTHIELYASPLVARTGLVDSLAIWSPNELWAADLHGDGRPEVVVDSGNGSWVVGFDERLESTPIASALDADLVPATAAVWFLGEFGVRRVGVDPAY
ncbi:MAG: VCBS repeat-containing protein [Proteobacteria bacterium]|nr:VCBS repeat-containing protein [Pseudomonadota bacterium]MCP4922019.1 VCBS repeat-containing protein [Pseudomonadota bacterium]